MSLRWLWCALGLLLLAPAGTPARGDEILVSAAASLTDAMAEIGRAFTKAQGGSVRLNVGASGTLQRQIEQGAPVDVFVSASPREMDALARAGRIERATRVNVASNRLVLVAPRRPGRASVARWADLARPAVRRVAVSNPETVPSGRYAEETLRRRRLWDAVRAKAVLGENVRQTLAYVATGDVDAGVVFGTDARVEARRVRVVARAVPGVDHSPVLYPAAVVAGSARAVAARRFVRFLAGPAARAILRRYGFEGPTEGAPAKPAARRGPTRKR